MAKDFIRHRTLQLRYPLGMLTISNARLRATGFRFKTGFEAALELGQMPGVDMKALQPTIKFWKVVRDQSQAAALACVGANHTLAGALVAFRLLRNIGGEETEDHAK